MRRRQTYKLGFYFCPLLPTPEALPGTDKVNSCFCVQPSAAALERLAASVAAAKSRRSMFSRRRMFNEDADVSYINERNRIFNNKLERSFDTREIKQNFERGTAL